jgi:hypothetical protein
MIQGQHLQRSFAERGGVAQTGTLLVYARHADSFADEHERATHFGIAERLARLKGYRFEGGYDPGKTYAEPVYIVPSDTLVQGPETASLGIASEGDLFGGVVPFPFVATKAITHPLVADDSARPEGWSSEFAPATHGAVHRGFTAFCLEDARHAFHRLIEDGPVRIKPVRATGGRGQAVVSSSEELDECLGQLDKADLTSCGLVLEENLEHVTTYSIGEVRVAGIVAAYCGTQRLTRDNAGQTVYGGSDLTVVRGSLGRLSGMNLPQALQIAVMQAELYDRVAVHAYPGLIASRRNYDVAQGLDHRGTWRSGVLEQSWRLGGASPAEVAALEALRSDPAAARVHASSVEIYGEAGETPPGATVYFRGHDSRVGPITKYALVSRHDVQQ